MEYQCDEKLRAELAALREGGGEWSISKLAGEIGYSPAVISQYLSGNKYAGDMAAVEAAIREFLRDMRLKLDSGVETIPCDIAGQIEDAIEDIRTSKKRGAILGVPGIGKSRGVQLYCKTHERAIAMLANAWTYDKWAAARILLKAADVTQEKTGLRQIEVLSEKLRGSSRPIIVDDAHKLTRDALQLFFDFTDATGMPLVLTGTPELEDKLKDNGQRLRRTGIVTRLRVRDEDGFRALVEHHVRQILPDAGGDEAGEVIALARKIVGREQQVNGRWQIVPHAGAFGSLQMTLALAVRMKGSKAGKTWAWTRAIENAHTRQIRDHELKG